MTSEIQTQPCCLRRRHILAPYPQGSSPKAQIPISSHLGAAGFLLSHCWGGWVKSEAMAVFRKTMSPGFGVRETWM